MKKFLSFIVCGLLATSSINAAEHEDSLLPGWEATATATLASDYVWRGVSQTANRPAIQGSVDVSHESGFYAGIWASNIESFDAVSAHSIEIDLYAGLAGETDFGGALPLGLGWDVGWLRYEFPSNSAFDLDEIYAGLSLSPLEWLSVSYYYYLGSSIEQANKGNYQDANVDISLPWDVGLGLHVGQYDQRAGLADYVDWKISLSKAFAGFNFEVAFTDTDNSAAGTVADETFVVSVSRTLGDPAPSESLPWGIDASANVTLATDYIYRGISQTGNDPAIQGSFDISHESGAYIGVWASNVSIVDGAGGPNNIELDFYAGIAGETSYGLEWDVGWLRYEYPGATGANFNEIYGGLSYSPLEIFDIGFTYYAGLEIEHQHPGQYYDTTADIRVFDWISDTSSVGAFVKDLNLGVHYGYYNLNRDVVPGASDPDYSDWKVGVSKAIGSFNFEIAYTDTDLNGASSTDDARALFTVSTDL